MHFLKWNDIISIKISLKYVTRGPIHNIPALVQITAWLRPSNVTGDPLHSRAACTQPCNVNTFSHAHCSHGARLCEQWGHGCVNNGARLCASDRLCRGSPVNVPLSETMMARLPTYICVTRPQCVNKTHLNVLFAKCGSFSSGFRVLRSNSTYSGNINIKMDDPTRVEFDKLTGLYDVSVNSVYI